MSIRNEWKYAASWPILSTVINLGGTLEQADQIYNETAGNGKMFAGEPSVVYAAIQKHLEAIGAEDA